MVIRTEILLRVWCCHIFGNGRGAIAVGDVVHRRPHGIIDALLNLVAVGAEGDFPGEKNTPDVRVYRNLVVDTLCCGVACLSVKFFESGPGDGVIDDG